ncbi:MAG: CRISPR-associated endonuclease Cas6 [Methanosarcina sp.]|jgi:hypothetical protein|nr:CRISPR-associated endonuclease Cas6 [Methanosarcina sp.]MDD4620962.1 CRISPR-associated endonuclease Cas6 [Methanosarcina sp.]NLN44407.1 CRISPR-associated endonuclease Cas6 [Methanosarcina sp.]
MMLDTAVLILNTDRPVKEPVAKLRGFIGDQFPDYSLLHHHVEDGYLYTYPKVQYKIIEGTPLMIGIDEGAKVLKEISGDIKRLELGKSIYIVSSKQINEQEAEIIPQRVMYDYRFLTPWFALNEKNYSTFTKIESFREKKLFLNNILVGNLLSMCKGLGIIVNTRLHVHSRLSEEIIEFKGISFTGFTGEFTVNFRIPDFFGIGKNASHGFGTVRRIKETRTVKDKCHLQ